MSETKRWPNPDNLPVIGPLKPLPATPADGAVAICGQCGLRIMRVMHYVCGNSNCPVQPRVTL